jgi:hypothetical protein
MFPEIVPPVGRTAGDAHCTHQSNTEARARPEGGRLLDRLRRGEAE